ncbi:hypothetical protein [Actinotalea fermentans]|uniref:hypothetical protein n=1 Tax=Actinotalea fermentans TaxID=43671 RepID=UPI001649C72F|nr:hypothetical protein [Actinotalea fermentans]
MATTPPERPNIRQVATQPPLERIFQSSDSRRMDGAVHDRPFTEPTGKLGFNDRRHQPTAGMSCVPYFLPHARSSSVSTSRPPPVTIGTLAGAGAAMGRTGQVHPQEWA